MCSTWLPTVLGEMTSRSPISRFDRPRATSLSTSISRAVRPVGPLAAAGDPVAGRAEHRLDGVPVEAAGPHLRAQLSGRAPGGAWGGRYGRGSRIAW